MDDRMRASDAEREAVTARLRDHYAEGRLTHDELDERVSAALSAKTFGELRTLTTDLPGPAPVPPRAAARPSWGGPPPWRHRTARRYRCSCCSACSWCWPPVVAGQCSGSSG